VEERVNVAKKAAGEAAAKFVKDGMLVGLGTGSTAFYVIQALGRRCKQEGLKIQAVATSIESERLAREEGILLLETDKIEMLDMTIDGADEVDPKNNMIKGRGGALLREKILAQSSKEMIVIVDSSKVVEQLGGCPVPVEIASYAYRTTLKRLLDKGFKGKIRLKADGNFYITDNKNYIIDIKVEKPISDPIKMHEQLQLIAGVLETGLFFNVAKRVVIGDEKGNVEIRS